MPATISGTATFSAAVSAGNRLNCWKMNPRSRRRNRMRSRDDRSSSRVPSTDRSPSVRSSRPAMIEISVVLPQPLGPTRKLNSPTRVSKSTPRKASTRASPDPNCFRTPRHNTPTRSSVVMTSRSEDRSRLKDQDPANAEQTRDADNEQDASGRERDALPHQHGVTRGELAQHDFEERRRQPGAKREPEGAGRERLQEDHSDETPVRDTNRLERAKLLQVVDREEIEGLASDHGADDDGDTDGDAEVHGNSGVLNVVLDAVPHELLSRARAQARRRMNPCRQFLGSHTGIRPRDDEGQLRALAAQIIDRLAVPRVHDRQAGEERQRIGDADDADAVIIHLQRVAEREWLARKEQEVACLVDHDGIGLPQTLPRPEHHVTRRSGQRGIVDAD